MTYYYNNCIKPQIAMIFAGGFIGGSIMYGRNPFVNFKSLKENNSNIVSCMISDVIGHNIKYASYIYYYTIDFGLSVMLFNVLMAPLYFTAKSLLFKE